MVSPAFDLNEAWRGKSRSKILRASSEASPLSLTNTGEDDVMLLIDRWKSLQIMWSDFNIPLLAPLDIWGR
jgi:hypothetical protein